MGGSSNEPNVGLTSITTPSPSNSDELTALRNLLEKTGLLSPGELAMSMVEILDFVRERLIR